jgi:hypothetical protein
MATTLAEQNERDYAALPEAAAAGTITASAAG